MNKFFSALMNRESGNFEGAVGALDREFARLHCASIRLAEEVPADKLHLKSGAATHTLIADSCGEHLLRSAACVEQTAGGITANLWDDPFEWTLPETLATPAQVIAYLNEVEATRRRCFECFGNDDEQLLKRIVVPSGEAVTLFQLLIETLARAAHHHGQAVAVFRSVVGRSLPEV